MSLESLPTATEDGLCPLTTDEVCFVFLNVAEMICGKLYVYQQKIALEVFNSVLLNLGDVLTIMCARQSGKSQVVSAVCCALMLMMPILAKMFPNDERFNLYDPSTGIELGFKSGFHIGVFGPKKDTADIIYNRIRGFLDSPTGKEIIAAFELKFDVSNGRKCSLTNGSMVVANTANEGASIEGHSYHLIITDETQEISDKMIEKSILPMGASTNACAIHIGTSTIGKCYFYKTQRVNIRNFINGGKKSHFEVHWKEAAKENKYYAKFVETQKIRLGDRSDAFKMSFCNEWILERGQFITRGLIESVKCEREVGDYHTASHLPRAGKLSCVAGIDFAKTKDRTVLTIGVVDFDNPVFSEEINDETEWRVLIYYGVDLVEWLVFEGDDYEHQYTEINKKLKSLPYKLLRLALDATGCGTPIADRFKAEFSGKGTEVLPVTFSLKSKDEMYRHLMRAFRQKHLTTPSLCVDEEHERYLSMFTQELEDLEKTYSNGLLCVRHPDEANAHDDFPDSLALMNLAASSEPQLNEVDIDDNSFIFR